MNLKLLRQRGGWLKTPKSSLLLQELQGWPGVVLNSHKSASQPFHKLSFIADLGLTKDNPDVATIAEKIFQHQSEEGPFQLPTNVPKAFWRFRH